MLGMLTGVQRRLQRMRRRRKVGRAYDMALEIARVLPPRASVLDVGCGNGFIAHHLAGILRSQVVALDVGAGPKLAIDYVPYDGRHFPLVGETFEAVILCYVLHHAQDAGLVLSEVARVLKPGGLVVVYEDMPERWLDKGVCWIHSQQWMKRTGTCTFHLEAEWQKIFSTAGFELIYQRNLSRWRNIAHPVSRRFFVLQLAESYRQLQPPVKARVKRTEEAFV